MFIKYIFVKNLFYYRKNIDQESLQAVMDILKGYVTDEYFPKFEEVVNFKFSFWEDKIFRKVSVVLKY